MQMSEAAKKWYVKEAENTDVIQRRIPAYLLL